MTYPLYIAAQWHHLDAEYPVFMYHELDESHYETRKVEVFLDGRILKADDIDKDGDTALSYLPLPSLEEMQSDPECDVRAITRDEFEQWWRKAVYA